MADNNLPQQDEATSTSTTQSPTMSNDNNNSEDTLPKPPTLRNTPNPPPIVTSSSNPLSALNNARRPGIPPPRVSGLTSDMAAKMRNFAQARQGPPRPGAGVSSPTVAGPPRLNPKGPVGGMKRGPKLNLADAVKKDGEGAPSPTTDTGSQFKQYSKIVDTQKGTLNFADKAVVHAGGIDFSNGTTFSISLDEVDTLEELGKGNYGTVFKVRHSRPKMRRPGQGLRGNMQRGIPLSNSSADDRPSGGTSGLIMAMKEIRLELDDAKFAQIIMELDILHRCVSPFIIDFYGAFFQEGSVYICLENMDGGSIDKLYGDGVPENVLRKITLSTVMGLSYLKDTHNIIHRDVKPTNILVNTKGQVKICDFGVSGNLVASMARTNIGCQSYMAPERISGGGMASAGVVGTGAYSVQSDIWSLALSIIECALGRYPYPPETYNNIFSQLNAIVEGEPPTLPADRYSEAARDFINGCLNKIPKMRPTYAMLLRHAWLAPLMKPPTISEDEEAEKAAEAGGDASGISESLPSTEDKEVAAWVRDALEKKKLGKMVVSEKPALHAAPLDTLSGPDPTPDIDIDSIHPNPGVRVESPELLAAKINSLDFA